MFETGEVFREEANAPENRPIFLYEIQDYDNLGSNLYFAQWDEDVEFDGQTYQRFPIRHENIGDNSQAEIDQVTVTVANVSLLIQAYLENYDWRGKKVIIRQVFADQLDEPDAVLTHIMYIDDYSTNEKDAQFTLTTKFDVLDIQLPLGAYNRNHCRWRFKGTECGYAGAETTCNKTKQDCRDNKDNILRFGGFPSIPQRRLFT